MHGGLKIDKEEALGYFKRTEGGKCEMSGVCEGLVVTAPFTLRFYPLTFNLTPDF